MLKHMTLGLLVCLSGGSSLLLAQNPGSTDPKLPPALQQAIDRILKQEPGPIDPGRAQPATALSSVCSVPLLEMHVDHPERFDMPQMTAPPVHDAINTAPLPAPPCQPKTP